MSPKFDVYLMQDSPIPVVLLQGSEPPQNWLVLVGTIERRYIPEEGIYAEYEYFPHLAEIDRLDYYVMIQLENMVNTLYPQE